MTAAEVRVGVLTPHDTPGPEVEFAALAPGQIVTRLVHVAGAAGAGEATSASDLATRTVAPYLDRAAHALPTETIEAVGYASTTSGYVIGYDAEMAMLARLGELIGRPAAATCPAAVHALRVLGVHRLVLIGAPWFEPSFNELGAAYFTARGFDVVCFRSAVELPHDPAAIEPTAVCDWTARHVEDDADGVFIGGNGFRAAAAIEPLEAALGRPVLTANQVLLWQLLAGTGQRLQIHGFGRLFTHPC